MPLDSRHAIVCTAVGYTPQNLAPFFDSLRSTGYSGKVLFFTHSLSQAMHEYLQPFNVEYIPMFPPLFSGRYHGLARAFGAFFSMLAKGPMREHFWRLSELWLHINNSRYTAYRRYFENSFRSYDEVILIDARDAVFQRHPFSVDYGCDIGYFEEGPNNTIGSCASNSEWIQRAYGRAELARLANKVVICSGVTYLRQAGIMPYLQAMERGCSQANARNIIDQGIHNYLAYHDVLPGGRIIPQAASYIWTVGCNPIQTIQRNADGLVINASGQVATIVHQYDRLPSLAQSLPLAICGTLSKV